MKVYIQPIYDSNRNEIGVIVSEKNNSGITREHKEIAESNIVDFIINRYYPEVVTFNYFSDTNHDTPSIIALKNDGLNHLDGASKDI